VQQVDILKAGQHFEIERDDFDADDHTDQAGRLELKKDGGLFFEFFKNNRVKHLRKRPDREIREWRARCTCPTDSSFRRKFQIKQ